MMSVVRASFAAFVVLFALSCASTPPSEEAAGTVAEAATIAPPPILPANASIPVGAGQQFAFQGVSPKGKPSLTWSVADPSIASVSANGFAVGLKPGVTSITGVLNGTITSHAQLTVNTAKLIAIDVSPTTATFPVGPATHSFSAKGVYSAGPAFPLLPATTLWASSNSAVATVSPSGAVQAVGDGVATISATDQTTGLSNGTRVTVTGAGVTSVTIASKAGTSIPAGLNATLVATAIYGNGVRGGCTGSKLGGVSCATPSDISWSVSDPTVATVSDAGVFTAMAPGTVTVTATYVPTGISGVKRFTVSNAAMTAIQVTTPSSTLPIDASMTLAAKAFGTYSNGRTFALNGLSLAALTWTSNPDSVATVAPDGTVTGVSQGSVVVTATDPISGVHGSVTLTVQRGTISALEITPTKVSLPVGTTQAFKATAVYGGGKNGAGKSAIKGDVTALAGWTSSDQSVALVSNADGDQGVVTSLAAGKTTINANFGGRSVTAVVTVTHSTLTAIAITPQTKTLPLGTTQQLVARGTFTGGGTHDITSLVTWSSSSGVTVSNAQSSVGLASAVASGLATITATDPTTGVAGTAWLTVSAAQLRSMAITPPLASIPYGTQQQFSATGTFSDSSVRDMTSEVLWSSSAPRIASISNASGSAGVAVSKSVGKTVIGALDPTTGLAASQATLTVTSASLTGLTVTPASATIANGFSEAFIATGTYSDGTQKDLTSAVTWTVPAGTATISNAAGSFGVAASNGAGASTIQAVEPVSGASASATLTVTSAQLVSIAMTPQALSVPLGVPVRFFVLGTFTDKSTSDLTGSSSWTSTNPLVASIYPGGIVTTNGIGVTTITATDTASGISASTTLSVTAAVLGRIFVQAVTAGFVPTTTWQLRATGDYTDGTLNEITSTLLWTSSNPAIFAVSNAAGSVGLGTAIAQGSVTMTATDPATGVTGTTVLTVAAARSCVPGTFTSTAYASGLAPYTLLTADMNGDGLTDLVSGDYSDGVRVLLGRADGTFANLGEFPLGDYLLSIAIGDINGDGIPDVVAPNYIVGTVTVGLGNGDGTLQLPIVSQGPETNLVMAALGDVDGDGKFDVAIGVNDPIGNLYIMKGNGDGTFAAAGPAMDVELDPFARPVASKFVDINGDGKLDLIVADEAELVLVLIGHGDGTFAPPVSYATANYPQSIEVRDVNGDGKLDVVVACFVSNVVSVLLGNGDGTFASHLDTPVGPWSDYDVVSLTIADFDGDGHLDVATGDGSTGDISILTGNGDGTFLAGFSFPAGHQVHGIASGDFNGDGKPDLAIAAEADNELFVLSNTCH